MGKTIFTGFKRLLHISAVIKQIPLVLQFHIFCTSGYIFFLMYVLQNITITLFIYSAFV